MKTLQLFWQNIGLVCQSLGTAVHRKQRFANPTVNDAYLYVQERHIEKIIFYCYILKLTEMSRSKIREYLKLFFLV